MPTPTPTSSAAPSPSPTADNSEAIHAGGAASGNWLADQDYAGGKAAGAYTGTIDTSGVTNAAPQAVYQSARVGSSFSYTLPDLGAGTAHTVRLHFAENYITKPGRRIFSVAMSGTSQTLDRFDIFGQTGALHKALAVSFNNVVANSLGNIVVTFTRNAGDASVNGIQVF